MESASTPTNQSIREVPGSYGLPLIGAIRDRVDYFRNTEEFFKSRMEKYRSTVFRVNMPPGGAFFPNPRVIMLLDAKSFPVLFDNTKVEKKNIFTGTYMPNTDFTGGYRVLSYLDPSEEKHTQLKNFCFEVLLMNRDRWLPEFARATSELWGVLEKQLAEKGRAVFNTECQQMSFNFLCRSIADRDPAEPGVASLGTDGPSLVEKWILFQIAPISTLGLPWVVEELSFHSIPLPFWLIKKDYEKIQAFFATYATRALNSAEKLGIPPDEAVHNLIFNVCFNNWGGLIALFPSLVRHIAGAGAQLHKDLAGEVRAAVRDANADGLVTMRALANMPLVQSTVYEVLRIDPPVTLQYGRAKENLVLESHDGRFRVRKGELLGGYQPFATKDPKVFVDSPEEFKPRRFMGEQGQKLLRYVLWSNGRETDSATANNKQCAGKDFTLLIGRLFLAELYLQYDSFEVEVSTSGQGSVSFTSVKKATS